jgi:hypothetical protein
MERANSTSAVAQSVQIPMVEHLEKPRTVIVIGDWHEIVSDQLAVSVAGLEAM